MILTLDTSGSRCGVALWAGGLLANTETLDNLRHNEVLFDRLHDLMSRHNVGLPDLTAVAVSSGPGSFTGLRVGMAAAKGRPEFKDIENRGQILVRQFGT